MKKIFSNYLIVFAFLVNGILGYSQKDLDTLISNNNVKELLIPNDSILKLGLKDKKTLVYIYSHGNGISSLSILSEIDSIFELKIYIKENNDGDFTFQRISLLHNQNLEIPENGYYQYICSMNRIPMCSKDILIFEGGILVARILGENLPCNTLESLNELGILRNK